MEDYHYQYQERILNWLKTAPWNKIYEFVEWCMDYRNKRPGGYGSNAVDTLRLKINQVLERHYSGYRLIDLHLVALTDLNELDQVKTSISMSDRFQPIALHISAAAKLLNPTNNPNFRNSVKESISAVEAAAKIVTGQNNATLGQALAWLEKSGALHGALKNGFSALYGWTSEADGIRHALMEDDKLSFDEAKYMLVACSAFSNYLIANHAKGEISK